MVLGKIISSEGSYEENDKREAVKGILSEVSDEEIEISEEKSKIVIKHSSIVHANLDY